MPAIWMQDQREDQRWSVGLLDGLGALAVDSAADIPVRPRSGDEDAPDAVLSPLGDGDGQWALLCACRQAGVSVNGRPIAPLGLRVLRDRDEIRLPDGRRLFYSAERIVRVQPFPGLDRPASCPRCHGVIETGQPAVRCPWCGVWHHQDAAAELPCWTYAAECAVCKRATGLQGEFRWSPEQIC